LKLAGGCWEEDGARVHKKTLDYLMRVTTRVGKRKGRGDAAWFEGEREKEKESEMP